MCAAPVKSEAGGASGASVADDATAQQCYVHVRVRVCATGVTVGIAILPNGKPAPAVAAPAVAAPPAKTWASFDGTHTWEGGVLSFHLEAVSADYVKEKLVPKLEASLYGPVVAQGAEVRVASRVTWQVQHAWCMHARALPSPPLASPPRAVCNPLSPCPLPSP